MSSGRVSIWPTSHRVCQQSLQDLAQRTYLGRLIPRQSIEVLDFLLPSVTLPNGNLFGSMTRGYQALMKGEGRMVGRLDGGQAFELNYLLC